MSNKNPRGNNNESEWEHLENTKFASRAIKAQNYVEYEDANDDENEETIDDENLSLDESDENFEEVLQLTQHNDDLVLANESRLVPAEYHNIDIQLINKKHQEQALKLVGRITNFIINMKDVELTAQHKNYLKQVASIEVSQLTDLLYLVDVNRQVLDNIIRRVDATQNEDYALLAQYTNIANQHLKFIKELSNAYKAIPSVIKKMKAEILCNQEIDENKINNDFKDAEVSNSGKQLLQRLHEKAKRREELKDSSLEN